MGLPDACLVIVHVTLVKVLASPGLNKMLNVVLCFSSVSEFSESHQCFPANVLYCIGLYCHVV